MYDDNVTGMYERTNELKCTKFLLLYKAKLEIIKKPNAFQCNVNHTSTRNNPGICSRWRRGLLAGQGWNHCTNPFQLSADSTRMDPHASVHICLGLARSLKISYCSIVNPNNRGKEHKHSSGFSSSQLIKKNRRNNQPQCKQQFLHSELGACPLIRYTKL